MNYLLFSSVGDSYDKAINSWYDSSKNYDIFFCYYEDDQSRKKYLDSISDICISQKGSKWQNFYKCYEKYDFEKYDYIWIVDDDIKLNSSKLNYMFDLCNKYKPKIAQPSMNKNGFGNHKITLHKKNSKFRYVNFIEVGVMLMRKDIIKILLDKIGKYLENKKLYCWGIDLICKKLFYNNKSFIIFDEIIIRNPKTKEKKGKERECFKYFNKNEIVKNAKKILKKF